MIDRNRKIIVVHMPKCGGRSVQKALGIPEKGYGAPRHGALGELYEKYPEVKTWPCYILVRNPFTRLVTHHNFVHYKHNVLGYRFPKKASLEFIPKMLNTDLQTFIDSTDWEEWLRIGEKNKSQFRTNSDMGKVKGIYSERLQPIYLETLTEQMKQLFGLDVPHLNSSPGKTPVWTPDNVGRIVEAFREDFDRFGYKLVPEDM